MITEIAEASSQLIHLIDDLLHQTQTRRLDAATSAASDDVQNFKNDLLARRLESVNLRLAGLQHGILVHLTDAESEQLHGITPNLDAFALLGLYQNLMLATRRCNGKQVDTLAHDVRNKETRSEVSKSM